MKKSIKFAFSLFVCGLILLSGCGKTTTSLPDELKATNTNYPTTITILEPSFFFSSVNFEKEKIQWLDEMSQRYKVNFNIISNIRTDSGDYDNSASQKMYAILDGDTSFTGLFHIFGSGSDNTALKSCIKNDIVIPLEDYLADNPVWNALPEDFKSLFKVDGHIYAIPTSVSKTQNYRAIRNDALQKTGKTVTDLNSFRDFAITYAQKTGNAAIGCICVYEMVDILNALGFTPI